MKNYYQLYITKGLGKYDPMNDFCICSCPSLVGIFKKFYTWKENKNNQKKYKIEKYNRYIFFKENNAVGIDFGDYIFFGYLTSTENNHVTEDFIKYLKGNN